MLNGMWRTIAGRTRDVLRLALSKRGYKISRTGLAYIDPAATIAAARAAGLSVCEYREQFEPFQHVGRRDRIIARLESAGVFSGASSVCEIGPGTGMFLEGVLRQGSVKRYELYETHRGWNEFLLRTYGGTNTVELVCHAADGVSLASTKDDSCDVVHAHGVFVYLPLLHSLKYLQEAVRVCRRGGYIVFDCYFDTTFSGLDDAEPWLASPFDFPVVIPRSLLSQFAAKNCLEAIDTFSEVHACGRCDYVVWRKVS